MFDLVEQTRDYQDDTFNYAVIKFIVSVDRLAIRLWNVCLDHLSQVALNEQFMLASLPDTPRLDGTHAEDSKRPEADNRVLRVLMSRLSSSVTFGENMIFMLNRASK